MIEKIVVAIIWFFITIGAWVVTRVCLMSINTSDITSIMLGLFLPLVVWFTVGYELKKQLEKFKK
jgi:hypothetical protein